MMGCHVTWRSGFYLRLAGITADRVHITQAYGGKTTLARVSTVRREYTRPNVVDSWRD